MDGGATTTTALFASATRVCGVCTTDFSRYKCPRCAAAYCSLACYKRHSETCTESFYAEQAKMALQTDVASPESHTCGGHLAVT